MIRHVLMPVFTAGILVLSAPSLAESNVTPAPDAESSVAPNAVQPTDWQGVIDLQVQAFRDGNADAALADAATFFRSIYPDSRTFFLASVLSEYGPISASQSDSFGNYQMLAPDSVLQRVSFTAKDQTLTDTIFHMGREEDGWRVEAVEIVGRDGIAV
jgi:putative salt-induced outer membrane protein YdiY